MKMTRLLLLILFIFSGLILPAQTQNNSRGIFTFYRYQYTNPWGDLLNNPFVSGGRKQIYWAEVNPAPGVYNWQEIDSALQLAQSYNKKLGLILLLSGYGGWQDPYAADGVPAWVYANGGGQGIDYLEWNGPPYTRYPVFWSDTIKAHFATLIEEFGAQYDNNPNVAYVIIGLYPEMNLGKDANNLQTEWVNAGYSDSVYESTVKWYIDLYADNFPNTQLSLACLSSKPIGLMTTTRFGQLRDNITAYMDSLPNGGIENNALADKSSWSFIQQWFRKHQATTHIIYEAVDKSNEAGGRAGDFRMMIENGLTSHADHFQIYYEYIKIATPGDPNYNPEYESALAFGAEQIGLEPGDSLRNNVWIRFNALIDSTGSGKFFFQGLYCDENAPYDLVEWPLGSMQPTDGEYLLVDSAGLPPRECIETNQSSGDYYIYLNADDQFIFGGINQVTIKVEYLDHGNDNFVIEYEGTSGTYIPSGVITKTNTNSWKTAIFNINNANFRNGQTYGNDFRINCTGDGDDIISFIQLIKNDITTIDVLNNKFDFNIYPNPTFGEFEILLNEEIIEADLQLFIYSIKGELVLSEIIECNNSLLNIKNLNLQMGLYVVQILNKGKILGIEKLVIIDNSY